MTDEDQSRELGDLFGDSQADLKMSPNIISFKEPASQKSGPLKSKKVERKKKPYASKARAKTKAPAEDPPSKSILSQYSHILRPDPLLDDEFIAPSESAPQVAPAGDSQAPPIKPIGLEKGKKQTLRHHVFIQLKEQGRPDSEIKKELKRLETLTPEDTDFELEKIRFAQTEHFTDKVAQIVKNTVGWMVEKALKADGKIQKEFEEDQALKDALHKAFIGKISFLGLNGQILLLAVSDSLQGFQKHRAAIGTPTENKSESK